MAVVAIIQASNRVYDDFSSEILLYTKVVVLEDCSGEG